MTTFLQLCVIFLLGIIKKLQDKVHGFEVLHAKPYSLKNNKPNNNVNRAIVELLLNELLNKLNLYRYSGTYILLQFLN